MIDISNRPIIVIIIIIAGKVIKVPVFYYVASINIDKQMFNP